ncbi:fatty acid desaturase [Kitasatospora sp. MAP5-34]|uniref:fatty acid desaturase family protein n=1 Tax=Kitasatospora sp. MAP5-34 TaxID=3035102 RepID=UPI00247453CB|nr:fatty acid desaturase [Kitasatospora sp. MAP5-34]MDH6578577.1 fatty acid desaturase [Kitasatospora sp. MAP5-34]
MPSTPAASRAERLFRRVRVSRRDEAAFLLKLLAVTVSLAVGGFLALRTSRPMAATGVLLLGATYTHMVELQHQCLHHSAFRRARTHRLVGVPLGLALLVSYSHYRVRHLQHHRFLGTSRDSEFFGFDTRRPITWRGLGRGLFDLGRIAAVSGDIVRSLRGSWTYDPGQISARLRRDIINEYRLMGLLVLAAGGGSALGYGGPVLRIWLLPLLVALPLHFLVELPEHLLCDTESTDVLRNTRSIRGSWFSTWYTNGNNLHIEHHAAMTVPINRLPERHQEVQRLATHVERSYPAFYRRVLREAHRNSRTRT